MFDSATVYRAVLDTNIFVSGTITSGGAPAQILNYWRNQKFVMVVSPQLVSEYAEVFSRPRVMKYTGLTPQENIQHIQQVRDRAYITPGMLTLDSLSPDPDDNIVLACAREGVATHLVTGNTKHFPFKIYEGIHIVSPREFLDQLEK